jgi:NAD(P)H-dependent flavin oxidoreductase YrpB (nitropropane dioxygenase family)
MSPAPDRIRRLCRALGIVHPVIQGGMTSVGTARLAAAVSAAGGMGLVSAGRMTPAQFGAEIDDALTLTDKPLGVNVPVTRDAEYMQGLLDAALSRRVSLVVLGGGNPVPWAGKVRAAGKTLAVVTANAEALGAAMVIVAGVEAGGKAGVDEIGGMVLIPEVADAVSIPVVATGGIVDGRSAAAAICLGAAAVQLGTRFMLSDESPLHPRTKQAMIDAGPADTLMIARRHGLARRMLDTPAARRVLEREPVALLEEMVPMLSGALSVRGLIEGDLVDGMVSCGQGVGRIRSIEPAGAIVRQIAADMRAVLAASARALDNTAPEAAANAA